MMTPGEWITLAGVGVAFIGLAGGIIVWAVRLEGKHSVQKVRIDGLEVRQAADEGALRDARSTIESQIANGFRDMRSSLERIYDKLDDKADKPR